MRRRSFARQLIATGLLSLALSACAAPVSQAPTAVPTSLTTPPVSTTLPTRPLPPLDDPTWIELWRGDNNANLLDERVLYLPTTLTPRTNFNDGFLAANAVVVAALVISEEGPDGTSLLFQVDQRGVSGPATQFNFATDATPTAFLAALDPGSSTFLSLLPLATDGTAGGTLLTINWQGQPGGYTLLP